MLEEFVNQKHRSLTQPPDELGLRLPGQTYQVGEIDFGAALQEDIERCLVHRATIKNKGVPYVVYVLPQPFERRTGYSRETCGELLKVLVSLRPVH